MANLESFSRSLKRAGSFAALLTFAEEARAHAREREITLKFHGVFLRIENRQAGFVSDTSLVTASFHFPPPLRPPPPRASAYSICEAFSRAAALPRARCAPTTNEIGGE